MITRPFSLFVVAVLFHSTCVAQTIVDTDFSKGDFAALGWKADGAWDVTQYPADAAKNPGPVARFAARQPNGTLTRSFDEIRNPRQLTLSMDYGWGWGEAGQASDSVGFMLLDPKGSGYLFKFHRCNANWAVQWGRVINQAQAGDMIWAPMEVDVSHPAVRDGGGLAHVMVTRDSDGTWSIASKNWNKGEGGVVRFNDTTTSSFSRIQLVGTENFDEQLFNRIVLATTSRQPVAEKAIPAAEFLNSVGICTTFPDRGQPLPKTIEMIKYVGFRWVRGGIEGVTTDGPTTLETYLELHRQTGVRFNWGLVSGGSDLKRLLETARKLAEADALLAFEGNNEPNNWGVTYQGEAGGGQAPSWMAVAKLQRDLYAAVKADPFLKKYPVWSISENGGQTDNVGLQFLKIPAGAGAKLPDGTVFADAANVHNYIYHPGSPGLSDNKTWNAADPTSACKVDGLYGNYGRTWARHFPGYSEEDLIRVPRVTTETGCTIDGQVTEEIQALNLLSMYLDQFKRGWSHTSVYLLRDRTDEGGNQSFGFFKADYTPRKAAVYLHNLMTILADQGTVSQPGQLNYSFSEQPATVHDMLLEKSDGQFELIVWGEQLTGCSTIDILLGQKRKTVRIYDPTKGTTSIQTLSDVDSVQVSICDHPLVIEIPR